jgi:hypothetical protein
VPKSCGPTVRRAGDQGVRPWNVMLHPRRPSGDRVAVDLAHSACGAPLRKAWTGSASSQGVAAQPIRRGCETATPALGVRAAARVAIEIAGCERD